MGKPPGSPDKSKMLLCLRSMEAVHPIAPEQIQKYPTDNTNTKHAKRKATEIYQAFGFDK